MQRIVIQNFGPIKDATIEIPKFLLLIGEQASGKSTVAKLIYFSALWKKILLRECTNNLLEDIHGKMILKFLQDRSSYNFLADQISNLK